MSTTRPPFCSIGNDVTQQNPLVAWQIRTGVRHHGLKLYAINSRPSKIHRQAKVAVEVAAAGGERKPLRWLATEQGQLRREDHRSARSTQSGARSRKRCRRSLRRGYSGRRRFAISFRSAARFGGKTKFMALGDYSNSRGAADMGVLPDRLPGYAPLSDSSERARFGKLWGGAIPSRPGLTARAMVEAAVAGKFKALYVVGANPAQDVRRRRSRPHRWPRTARRARHVPHGNGAARRRGFARRLHLRKGRHAHEYRRRSAIDASLDRSAGSAQRFRPAAHSFASTQHARARRADSIAHPRSGVR